MKVPTDSDTSQTEIELRLGLLGGNPLRPPYPGAVGQAAGLALRDVHGVGLPPEGREARVSGVRVGLLLHHLLHLLLLLHMLLHLLKTVVLVLGSTNTHAM